MSICWLVGWLFGGGWVVSLLLGWLFSWLFGWFFSWLEPGFLSLVRRESAFSTFWFLLWRTSITASICMQSQTNVLPSTPGLDRAVVTVKLLVHCTLGSGLVIVDAPDDAIPTVCVCDALIMQLWLQSRLFIAPLAATLQFLMHLTVLFQQCV